MYLVCRIADNAQERRRVTDPLLNVERLSLATGILADVIGDVIHGVPTDVSGDVIARIPADVIYDVITGVLGDVIHDVIDRVLTDVIGYVIANVLGDVISDVIAGVLADVIVKHRSYACVDVRRVAGGRDGETLSGVCRRERKHTGVWRPGGVDETHHVDVVEHGLLQVVGRQRVTAHQSECYLTSQCSHSVKLEYQRITIAVV